MFKNRLIETLVSNKRHINSSFFLFFINLLNFVFPLLISPRIIQKCGLEGFGIVILFQSIAIFVSSITEYGFNINATRDVTLNQDHPDFINKHFFTVTYCKTILLGIAILLSILIYFFFPKANDYSFIYFTSLFILIGRTFNPLWVLRSLHKLKYIFYFFIFFKIISLLVIYLFLESGANLYLVNLTIGSMDLLTCIFSILVLMNRMKWKYYKPDFKAIKNEIVTGFGIFVQVISINANAYLNPMILGLFVNEYALGIYCVVEKVILVVRFCGSFIIQSLFPKACEMAGKNHQDYKVFARKLFIFLVISMLIAAMLLVVFSNLIVSYFVKMNIAECSAFLVYNSLIPFVVAFNMVPYLTFMVYSKQKAVTKIIILSVFINVILNTILSKQFGIFGISAGIYITELFVSISLWAVLIFKFPNLNFLKNEK
ncbi:oligosaccharide flippase family protein [Flavobacterium sp. IMCC34518]|uniref:oligosaccharide flippase family protein n=1 Tax=Flavobacterium sp. IMCC34518 TaxID=3003623 RepID=UPI0022AC8C2F|nr:oligosaccharide flippase family protein [Flavobacterium sp. IMCC34518]